MADRAFAARVASANKRIAKNHDRATARWADRQVALDAARKRAGDATATYTCPDCAHRVRRTDKFCPQCGKELLK